MSDRPGPQREMKRWRGAAAYLRGLLGGPARKVPLDAGFSCPNRDGTLSRAGCSFCNAAGSGTGLSAAGLSLRQQWERLAPRALARDPRTRLMGYLQAYSNTHASPQRLRAVLAEAAELPGIAGLCLGTRPDCLDADGDCARLDALAGAGFPFLQLDLGLQSADPAVLLRCGRGHGPEVFALAARAAAARGLLVCAHLVHGLPGAAGDDLEKSVEFLNALPIAAVKFHNLLVCRGTRLAGEWERGQLVPAGRDEYVAALIRALARLRPDICVERLFADPAPGELLAPDWAAGKAASLDFLRAEMRRLDTWQGRVGFCENAPPDFGG